MSLYCYYKNDWPLGLALLSKSSDEALRDLATRELGSQNSPSIDVADAWWSLSDKLANPPKLAVQRHAANLYSSLTDLSGVDKARAETRIAAVPPVQSFGNNLIPKAKPEKGTVSGTWKMVRGRLNGTSDDRGRFQFDFPLRAGAEYDYRVQFIRHKGNDTIALVAVSTLGRQFSWTCSAWLGERLEFEGTDLPKIPTGRGNAVINGKQHTIMLKVRKNKIEAYFDGKLIQSYEGSQGRMGGSFGLNDKNALGLGLMRSDIDFISAEVELVR